MASFDASVQVAPWTSRSDHAFARRAFALGSRCLLVTLFAVFAWSNFSHWRQTGAPSGLGVTLLEGWAAVLFLTRRAPRELSLRPIAWVAVFWILVLMVLFSFPTSGNISWPFMVGIVLLLLIYYFAWAKSR